MSALVDETQAGFEQRYSYAPQGIWSAPGRVNLIGEHTDYNQGFVLPFAIDRRTFAALALRDDDVVRVLLEEPPEDLREKAQAAVDACPMVAIKIED